MYKNKYIFINILSVVTLKCGEPMVFCYCAAVAVSIYLATTVIYCMGISNN